MSAFNSFHRVNFKTICRPKRRYWTTLEILQKSSQGASFLALMTQSLTNVSHPVFSSNRDGQGGFRSRSFQASFLGLLEAKTGFRPKVGFCSTNKDSRYVNCGVKPPLRTKLCPLGFLSRETCSGHLHLKPASQPEIVVLSYWPTCSSAIRRRLDRIASESIISKCWERSGNSSTRAQMKPTI